MSPPKFALALLLTLPVASIGACSDGDEGHDHGTVHVQVTDVPPATVAVGDGFEVSWEVHNDTHDDLHHSEIRVCAGADMTDCGLGDQGTYTSVTGTMDNGVYTATVTLAEAGSHTLVAWCHVGEDPHLSDAYTIDAE